MRSPLIVLGAPVAAGCATAMGQMRMPNPALAATETEATQSFGLPPFEGGGLPSSYSLTLVDDRGRRYAFEPLGAQRASRHEGHMGATLYDAAVGGTFPVTVDGSTRFVTLKIRPIDDRACSPVDLRWNFASPAG